MSLAPMPTTAEDVLGNPLTPGTPIVYGAGDGYIHFGIVREIKAKVVERWDYETKTEIKSWAVSLKVEKAQEKWSSTRHVNLSRLINTCALDGTVGNMVIKDIEDSWLTDMSVDTP